MNHSTHNRIAYFIWSITDNVLHHLGKPVDQVGEVLETVPLAFGAAPTTEKTSFKA